MASSGKKGKKGKGKTVSLNDFLSKGSSNGNTETTTVHLPSSNWADEMDKDDNNSSMGYGSKPEAFVLPTAPRAAREQYIPEDPPFIAYVSNLSFDVDKDEVMNFFLKQKLKDVRIPTDRENGRVKGHGYVEFENRESLMEALKMDGHPFKQRPIKIELSKNDVRGGFNDRSSSRYGNRDKDDDDKTPRVWRTGPSSPQRGGNDRRDGDTGGSRSYDRYEPPQDRDDRRDGNRGYGFGRDDRGGGFGGDRDRRDGGSRDGGYDRRDRGGFERYDRKDDRGTRSPEPPKERQRLKLLPKRTDKTESSEESESTNKTSSIFGGAKPVDTAKKEAEIEQKLQESQTRVRTIDLASKRRDQEEERRKRVDSEKETDAEKPVGERPSIFGSAKPVDTSAREKEIEEKAEKPVVERSSIFGGAKPVDTSAREKEIEEKLKKETLTKAPITTRRREDSHRSDGGSDSGTGLRPTSTDSEYSGNRDCDGDDDSLRLKRN